MFQSFDTPGNRLETRKKALLSEKSKLTKENADKKAALDVLENQLEEFVTVSLSAALRVDVSS